LGIRRQARSAAVIVLTLTKATLDSQRPAAVVHHDDRVRAVGLARTTQVFDLVSRAKHAIIEHGALSIVHSAQVRNLSQNRASTIAVMNERLTTRSDYATRLERVFRWLADHLDDTLDLVQLADVAALSPHHFHRIYHAMQGETAAETVRRLRLHRAAVELITGELPVPRIARRAGYGSQEAFTRAFKTAYGVPPARYRASFVPSPRPGRSDRTGSTPTEDAMDTTMTYQATIRETPAIRVAALAHRGDYLNIGSTFERLAAMAVGQDLFGPWTRSFGIYYDDPATTPREALRADACVTLPDGRTPAGDLQLREIRGGRFAVTLHVGPYAELHIPYAWLYGTWLPQSGEEAADAPIVEEYLNDAHTVAPSDLRTEIWLPLR
jgi:AraC family transcriptional regulator